MILVLSRFDKMFSKIWEGGLSPLAHSWRRHWVVMQHHSRSCAS